MELERFLQEFGFAIVCVVADRVPGVGDGESMSSEISMFDVNCTSSAWMYVELERGRRVGEDLQMRASRRRRLWPQ